MEGEESVTLCFPNSLVCSYPFSHLITRLIHNMVSGWCSLYFPFLLAWFCTWVRLVLPVIVNYIHGRILRTWPRKHENVQGDSICGPYSDSRTCSLLQFLSSPLILLGWFSTTSPHNAQKKNQFSLNLKDKYFFSSCIVNVHYLSDPINICEM